MGTIVVFENISLDGRDWPESVRGTDRLARILRERLADVLLYRELATLRRDVPLRESLEDLRYRGPDDQRVRELLLLDAPATGPPAPDPSLS